MILSAEIQQLRKGVARRLCRSGRGGTVHQLQLYCRAQTSADRLEDGVAHVLSTDHRTGEGVDKYSVSTVPSKIPSHMDGLFRMG